MRDYYNVGQNIAQHFFWGLNPSYATYFTPVTPSFVALALWIGGEAEAGLIFRILVQMLAFVGALVLANEIAHATKRRFYGYALFIIVAFCRPSIFWSYKFSTEPVSEALLLLTAGLTLRALRTGDKISAFVGGAAGIALALNRPQFFPGTVLIGAMLLVPVIRFSMDGRPRERRLSIAPIALARVGCFVAGVALIWTPWIVRNYVNTHGLLLFSTSGTESILWDAGGGSIGAKPYNQLTLSDGTVIREFGLAALRKRNADLPSDYERQQKLLPVVNAWIRENWKEFPGLVGQRLVRFASAASASGLTIVPRDQLFRSNGTGSNFASVLDWLLFDKTMLTSVVTVAGSVIALLILRPVGLVLFALAIVPAISAAFVTSVERSVESQISLQLWLAFFALASATEAGRRILDGRSPKPSKKVPNETFDAGGSTGRGSFP